MDISTKGRYGVRALLDLAVHCSYGSVVTLASIAERQNISEGYLEQIISILRKAGIVTGIKGPQGGYMLARPAKEIFMRQVLESLEGDLFTVKEDVTGIPAADLMQRCIHQRLYQPMLKALTHANEGLTLADLVEDYLQTRDSNVQMYYI